MDQLHRLQLYINRIREWLCVSLLSFLLTLLPKSGIFTETVVLFFCALTVEWDILGTLGLVWFGLVLVIGKG